MRGYSNIWKCPGAAQSRIVHWQIVTSRLCLFGRCRYVFPKISCSDCTRKNLRIWGSILEHQVGLEYKLCAQLSFLRKQESMDLTLCANGIFVVRIAYIFHIPPNAVRYCAGGLNAINPLSRCLEWCPACKKMLFSRHGFGLTGAIVKGILIRNEIGKGETLWI